MEFDQFKEHLSPLFRGTGGIDSWLRDDSVDLAKKAIQGLDSTPISHSELDQLLILSELQGLSHGFFRYYWTSYPDGHPYDLTCCGTYDDKWAGSDEIVSLAHFKWGWTRFYTDALLYFGDLDDAFEHLRTLSYDELESYFAGFAIATEDMVRRGRRILVSDIPRDNRYLIAELACKTLEGDAPLIVDQLVDAYRALHPQGGNQIVLKELLEYVERQGSNAVEVQYALDEMLAIELNSEEDLRERMDRLVERFTASRATALQNTQLYLSMASELDVYVATSMRTREHFREMADMCRYIFNHANLQGLNVRYFDPTLSAASGHEDKGLIECLMVKSARALIYTAGDRDSWGKDAEAAMALSLGKPVVFYCSEELRKHIFDNIHPLSRLVSFERGVAVGAMVVSRQEDVVEILTRTFKNAMRYKLKDQEPNGQRHLRLEEEVSGSTVRLQTADRVLRSAMRAVYRTRNAARS